MDNCKHRVGGEIEWQRKECPYCLIKDLRSKLRWYEFDLSQSLKIFFQQVEKIQEQEAEIASLRKMLHKVLEGEAMNAMDEIGNIEDDRETVRKLEGLFVGQLTISELNAFHRLVRCGEAFRSFEGLSGHMGLAKVALRPKTQE